MNKNHFVTRDATRLARHTPGKIALLLCAGFLLLFLVQGWFFIRSNSQTVDEAAHLAAGYSYLVTGDFRLDSEHPPLIKMFQGAAALAFFSFAFHDLRTLKDTDRKAGIPATP